MRQSKSFVDGQKYYGIHACLALWEKRPYDVIRVYVHESNIKLLSPVLKGCAQQKKAYHVVSSEELSRITDSVHHEGVCVLAKELKPVKFADLLAEIGRMGPKICLLYLDGVQNPHNIGSILRTSAHFGIPYILGDRLPALSASACRIAKGGAELVRLVQLDNPLTALESLKKLGFSIVGTSSHGGTSLYQCSFSPRTILAFGSESDGIGKQMQKAATQKIQIPGTGAIESLNVSVATSLCLGEYARQHRQQP
ncbi:MAG TPA: TrmH family RNA methyltransferase [Chlamydiales bacterium]|nr:TrmH family RNA methyltransferase [Chlamydiales bacterium]